MSKLLLKNVILVASGIIIGTGIIMAVNADPLERTYYLDADGDGFGTGVSTTTIAETAPAGYATSTGDCNDNNIAIKPGVEEICDNIDNNCNGQVDEGVLKTYFFDADGDLFGGNATSTMACSAPANYVATSTDCNDSNVAIKPGAEEICDTIDNNCDGQIDEGVKTVFYFDFDGDLFGGTATTTEACEAPNNYAATSSDCNDFNNAINPNAMEIYDAIDNNCNGVIDEGSVLHIYYRDADNDTYGNPNMATTSYISVAGYVSNNKDCNDANSAIHPGATEIYDGIDNNCVNGIDEGFTLKTYYRDADGDTYGNPSIATSSYVAISGYVLNNSDCNDANSAIHPGVTELNDSVDNNCNGYIDEGFAHEATEPGNYDEYPNHGSYVSTWAHYLTNLMKNGVISGREKGQMQKEAAQIKKENKQQEKEQIKEQKKNQEKNNNRNPKGKK